MNTQAILLPAVEAAALANVSRATWCRLRSAGKVPPAIRLGRKVLWRRDELTAWISAGCPDNELWGAMQSAIDRRRK
jgi:excisionase family DNA binding protein